MVAILAALLCGAAVWATGRCLGREQGKNSDGKVGGRVKLAWQCKARAFQVWLSQSGAAVTPVQFCSVSVALGSVVFGILVMLTAAPATCCIPAGAAVCMPYAYWSAERRKQVDLRRGAWPDVIQYLAGVLGAGISTLHDALNELAGNGPVPLRPAFARYARLSSRVGDRRALEVLREQLADPVCDPVLLALAEAVDEGTDTVLRVLRDLGSQITADLQLRERIRTVQTQSRIANWGCFAIPYGVALLLCVSNRSYASFFSTWTGLATVMIGACLSVAGLVVSLKLVQPLAPMRRLFVGGVEE